MLFAVSMRMMLFFTAFDYASHAAIARSLPFGGEPTMTPNLLIVTIAITLSYGQLRTLLCYACRRKRDMLSLRRQAAILLDLLVVPWA